MSGFDVLFKSQQQMQQTRLGYDKMRYSMEQQAGQTLGQLPQNYLAGAKAASDLRIQEQQAEISAMQSKMQLSNMLEQSKQLKMQTQMGNLQLQQAQREFDDYDKTKATEARRKQQDLIAKLAPGALTRGMVPTDDGLSFRPMTPQERQYVDRNRTDQERSYNIKLAETARARIKDIMGTTKNLLGQVDASKLTQQQKQEIALLRNKIFEVFGAEEGAKVLRQLEDEAAAPATAPGATTPTQPAGAQPAAAQPGSYAQALKNDTPEVQQQFGQVGAAIESHAELKGLVGSMDEESSGSMMYGLAKVADIQVGLGTLTAERAAAHVVNEFANGQNPNLQAYVLAVSGRSDDQIAAYLMSRPYMQDRKPEDRRAVVETVLKNIRQTIPAAQQAQDPQAPQQPAAATATAPSRPVSLASGPSSPTDAPTPKPGEPGYITGVDPALASGRDPNLGPAPMSDEALKRVASPVLPVGGRLIDPPEVAGTGQPQGAPSSPPERELRPGEPGADMTTVPPVPPPPSRVTPPPVRGEPVDPASREPERYRLVISNPKASAQQLLKGMGPEAKKALSPLVKRLKDKVLKMRQAPADIAANLAQGLERLQGEALDQALPVIQKFKRIATELRGASPEYGERLLREGEEGLRSLKQKASKQSLTTMRDTIRQIRLSRRLDEDVEQVFDDIRAGLMTPQEGATEIKRLELGYEMDSERKVTKRTRGSNK